MRGRTLIVVLGEGSSDCHFLAKAFCWVRSAMAVLSLPALAESVYVKSISLYSVFEQLKGLCITFLLTGVGAEDHMAEFH
jgi:hypothetical protein